MKYANLFNTRFVQLVFWTELYLFNQKNDKHVQKLKLISLVGMDVSRWRYFMWEEAGVSGTPPYPLTYNHCWSWGSNSGHSGEKRVHCVLRCLDTTCLLISLCGFIKFLRGLGVWVIILFTLGERGGLYIFFYLLCKLI